MRVLPTGSYHYMNKALEKRCFKCISTHMCVSIHIFKVSSLTIVTNTQKLPILCIINTPGLVTLMLHIFYKDSDTTASWHLNRKSVSNQQFREQVWGRLRPLQWSPCHRGSLQNPQVSSTARMSLSRNSFQKSILQNTWYQHGTSKRLKHKRV